MSFETIDHTADLGVRVWAPSLSVLFAEAARAMTSLMADSDAIEGRETVSISAEGADAADLMVNWLREILYLWHGRELLTAEAEVLEIDETRIQSRIRCDPHDPTRHEIRHELKAVTYHDLRVEPTPDGWEAVVIFDV
ncbi:MAG: archease [Desulfococcaceae bacterium]